MTSFLHAGLSRRTDFRFGFLGRRDYISKPLPLARFFQPFTALQTAGGARGAGARQERREEGNGALAWGRVETGGGYAVG